MTVQELRIGNYVKIGEEHESYNCIGKVIKWDLSNFYSLEKGYNNIEWFEPIPITEEWLLKFKFDNNHWATKWILHDMPTPTGIHFVHQLQNLYFALTNEELTLKQ